MSPDTLTEMNCILNNKIKLRPGSTIILSEELQVPSGIYFIYIEHQKKDSSARKNYSGIAAAGELVIATGKDGSEVKYDVDFHREHPLLREIHVPEAGREDGEEIPNIKTQLTMISTAHIKKIRLRVKLFTKDQNIQAHVISSHLTKKKKNGRLKIVSNTGSPDTIGSARSTPSSSYSDLPTINSTSLEYIPSPLAARDEEEIDPPRTEKHVIEKDVIVIKKNTTYTSEGVDQNNTTQTHLELTKIISETADTSSDKGGRGSEKGSDMETASSYSASSFDPSEENLVYYKEFKLRKKHVYTEKIPIQQKGKYYLVIENSDKGPITRHFSCHAKLSQGTTLLKESITNDAKKKLSDDFTVDSESADLTLDIVHTNSSFGKSELQISLYMKNVGEEMSTNVVNPHSRTGEVVWSVSACEVEKKHPQKFTARIPTSGKYYIVAEKVDKIYGGLREIAVDATLIEPPSRDGVEGGRASIVSVVVGGVKARPMKWKSPIFAAPAGSIVEFNVMSYALVGSIIYSLRVRKVPGLTAEEERTRKIVLLFLTIFGIYQLLYIALSVLHFVQNIGFTLNILFLSVDITLGRLCFMLCATWFRTNQEILMVLMSDLQDNAGKLFRKFKLIRDMSDGGKFDILRIIKQLSKEGKMDDKRRWEMQKLQTANE